MLRGIKPGEKKAHFSKRLSGLLLISQPLRHGSYECNRARHSISPSIHSRGIFFVPQLAPHKLENRSNRIRVASTA